MSDSIIAGRLVLFFHYIFSPVILYVCHHRKILTSFNLKKYLSSRTVIFCIYVVFFTIDGLFLESVVYVHVSFWTYKKVLEITIFLITSIKLRGRKV